MKFDQIDRPADQPARSSTRAGGSRDARAAGENEAGRTLQFAPRSLVFLQGDAADAVFQIASGAAMLYKLLPDGRRQIVEILGAGDVFGFSPNATHDVSAETLTAVRCIAFDRADIESSPSLMSRLGARLYAQLCVLHEHVMLLGHKSSLERVATFLTRCVPGRGGPDCPGPRAGSDRADVRLALTRYGIADYLGMTIETVSRSLAGLKRRGIVSISKIDEVCIHDVCALCRLTGTHLACDHDSGAQSPAAMRARAAKDAMATGRSGLMKTRK
jgi:CRP/FNR family transcriptional regulator